MTKAISLSVQGLGRRCREVAPSMKPPSTSKRPGFRSEVDPGIIESS